MRIAVDAMGGDNAPLEIVHGITAAIDSGFVTPDQVVMVGVKDQLEEFVASHCAGDAVAEVEIIHASEVVEMCDSPTGSLRSKPDSSIQVALHLVQEGAADAFVSAGNTGAVVATAAARLGRLPGVRRPGIAASFHTPSGPVTLLDVGANVHCKPLHLFQYGVMAEIFCRDVLGVEQPRLALLNIGEEQEKGNPLVRETRALFEDSNLNFVGNVEGNQLLSGSFEVLVCEGFVGNVVLKVMEGVGVFLKESFQGLASQSSRPESAGAMKKLLRQMDYAEYGGAPLLGVNGLCMIMHGRSDRRATANALRVSRQFVEARVNDHILRAVTGELSGRSESESRQ